MTTTKSTQSTKLGDILRFITSSPNEKCVNILEKEKKMMEQLRIQRDKTGKIKGVCVHLCVCVCPSYNDQYNRLC